VRTARKRKKVSAKFLQGVPFLVGTKGATELIIYFACNIDERLLVDK
jgi:hypothetical protein